MSIKVTATPRPKQSKGALAQRMRYGFVPGSVYGKGLESQSIEVSAKAISELLLADPSLKGTFELEVAGAAAPLTVVVDNLTRTSA
jgi:ribosomal protein L25 (general stress protein Ctc)